MPRFISLSASLRILGCIVLSTATIAGAAPYKELGWHNLGRWEQPQGLPQNTVFSLRQSSDGYLWAGTRGGLTRFDGVSFTTYDNRDPRQLRDNEVWSLAEGADGSLWIGTYGGGLSRLRAGRFTVYTEKDGLASDFISTLFMDPAGALWIATDSGISCFKNGSFTNFTTKDGLGSNIVRSLCLGPDGAIWAGTMAGTVHQIRDGRVSTCPLGEKPPTSEVRALYQDRSHILWVGSTTEGLFRVENGRVTRFTEADGLPSNRIMALFEDHEGNLWIGTTNGLVRHRDGHFFIQSLGDEATRKDYIMALASDREGSLWVGTADQGFVCLRRDLFNSFTMEDGLPDEFITGVIEDANRDVLIGTRKGVTVIHDGHVTPYSARNGLPELSLLGLSRDRDDTIWINTEDGLYRSDRNERNAAGEHVFTRVGPDVPVLRHISARVVLKDHAGVTWIGTTLEGLVRGEAGRYTIYTTKDGLSNDAIRGLIEDRDGALWIGTRGGGLNRFKDGKFTVYTEKDGLVSNIVQTLYRGRDDTLWIGTRQGLGRLRDGKFTRYTAADGLFVNYVSGITEDQLGNLWMSCARGVFRVSKAQLDAFADGRATSITCTVYGAEHGLSSTVGSVGIFPSVYTTQDGSVWFATFNGANVIDPTVLKTNRLAPPVHLTGVTIDRQPFDPEAAAKAPPGRGDLNFRYAGVSFLTPEKMRFKYQLEGYDPDWVDAGARREAFYSNIPPGSYRFRVIAANSDGVWNETGAAIDLVLQPHIYQARWFRALLVLVALGLVLGAVRLRLNQLRRRAEELRGQNVELERRIATRTAELSKSYDDLRASEYFYQSLVESLPQIILRKDVAGRITYANSGFGELVGRPVVEVIGRFESDFYPAEMAAKFRADDQRVMAAHQAMEFQTVVDREGQSKRYLQVKKVPLYAASSDPIGVQVLFWDTTVFRETEEKLKEAQREMIEVSRLAGIAEVATGVLHNLGNALNSVNTSVSIATTAVRQLKVQNLTRIAQLMAEQGDQLGSFLTNDARGRKIPEYLALLANDFSATQADVLREINALRDNIEHIKEIVAAQQADAQMTGVNEIVPASELMEYALRISEPSLQRHGITVSREFMTVDPVNVQRGKALQVLGNLIRNAKDALKESDRPEKRLTLGIRSSGEGRVQLYVTDNGIGISRENLTRIFAFGFTTKQNGHGFGLHSSALAARELGGSLTAESAGLGLGATFVLELPPSIPAPLVPSAAIAAAATHA
jgi:PAS domain S-box-containing protein